MRVNKMSTNQLLLLAFFLVSLVFGYELYLWSIVTDIKPIVLHIPPFTNIKEL